MFGSSNKKEEEKEEKPFENSETDSDEELIEKEIKNSKTDPNSVADNLNDLLGGIEDIETRLKNRKKKEK